ncbi:hypothetical protein [Janibacter indicus]|uniref:hypothetical protein n=1 Tax=Janibacter indicus TaxID=857417 RepID=UPI003EBB43C4
MSRSLYVTSLKVRLPNKRKDNPAKVIDALPAMDDGVPVAGGDLLTWLHDVIQGFDDDALVDAKTKNYAKLAKVDYAPGHPRVLVAEFDAGRYGEPGRDIDTTTHVSKYERKPHEAATHRVRVVFVAPKGSDAVMMLAETANRSSVRGRLVNALKARWEEAGFRDQWMLSCKSVVEQEAWLASAELTKVRAVEYNHSSDWGSDDGERTLGEMTYTLELSEVPVRVRQQLLDALKTKDVKASAALGIEISDDDDDLDEVYVTLTDGNGKSKTFVIDKERTPSVQIALGDLESDPSKPNHLVSKCISECPRLFQVVGADWHAV